MAWRRTVCVVGCAAALAGSAARAEVDPVSGIDFVTIGAVGNAAWPGTTPPTLGDEALGRGSVSYEYRIGRFEVTTAQWAEFMSAALDRPQSERLPWIVAPTFWGAVGTTPNTPGGQRFRVPAGREMLPVGDISWRMAAMLCNWHHNGKSLDREAFMNGAYDVRQFSGTDRFTDQLTRNTGARYWIPSTDEWLKAAHYDPNKNGLGQGGWWTYSNGTNQQLIPGPPGVGQANYAFFGPVSPFEIPLGAYPDVQSPWGLFDLAGATSEWTEGIFNGGQMTRYRIAEGSFWQSDPGFGVADSAFSPVGAYTPGTMTYDLGFRIASAVPSPTPMGFVLVGSLILARRRSRRS